MAADSINYQLRPNKNVERKMFIEMFRRLESQLPIRDYRYIGLGGLWFADFLLIHRELGLTDLISIEMRQPERAEFNRPFNCVQVERGETSLVLPDLDLGNRPAIIWLDYDSDLSGPALEDIAILASQAAAMSICIVTIQAHIGQVSNVKGPAGEDLSRLDALEYYAGDLVPDRLKNADITGSAFPGHLGEIMFGAFKHGLRTAARHMRFQPLLHIAYKDGAPMITVGGLLHTDKDNAIRLSDDGSLPFWPPSTTKPYRIQVPLLTMREKAALDQMMPGDGPPDAGDVERVLGFRLSGQKLAAYRDFYRQYPMFAEYEF